jgi:hypothetical protein
MKKTIMLFTAIIMIAGFSTRLTAQETATATATATIVTPIAITKMVDMNFGNIAVTGTAGTVILDPAGSRAITGGVTLPTISGTVAAASFDVTGNGEYTYSITLPSGDHTITESGSANMIVNAFTSNPSGTGALTSGAQTITVGATLNVGVAQVAGEYTNATGFDVTVNYN